MNVYPNPFNPSTTISFTLPQAGEVKLAVYDILGRITGAQQCAPTVYGVGEHQIPFDGSGLSSGIYLVRMEAKGNVQTSKIVLLK